jgi:hypothetical protein
MKRRAEAIAKLDRYHPHSVKQHPLLSQEQKQRLMRSTLPCSKARGTDNGAAGRRTEGTMARHFGLKLIVKTVKKPKESPKVYSPASWRGKPERRALSTR